MTNGIACYYVITALDDAGNEGAASAEVSATPTAPPSDPPPGGCTTLTVIGGWDQKVGLDLEAEDKTDKFIDSDDSRWETESGDYTSLVFSDWALPAGATITSVTVHVEHSKEDDFAAGGILWQVGTGWPDGPDVWGTTTAVPVRTEDNEGTDSWDVTAYVNTAARVNSLELYIGNIDPEGKKTKVDYVYVVVESSS